MNNHKPNAFKPLLWGSQFPRSRDRGYQSQEHSRKQEGMPAHIFKVYKDLFLLKYILFLWPVSCWIFLQLDVVLFPAPENFLVLLGNWCYLLGRVKQVFLSSYLGAQMGVWKIAWWLQAVWQGRPQYLKQVLGDQNQPGVLSQVSGAGTAFIPSSRGDNTTLVVGQLKEGESCSLRREVETRSPKQFGAWQFLNCSLFLGPGSRQEEMSAHWKGEFLHKILRVVLISLFT